MTDFNTFEAEAIAEGRVDYDHVYQYQCVDLILQYAALCYGVTGERGNAIDYWNDPSPIMLTKFTKIATQAVQRGDIVILNGLTGNPYGHVMIGTGNDTATTFEGLEQNGGSGDGDGLTASGNEIRTRFVAKSRIAGVLRPTALIAQPETVTSSAPSAPSTLSYTVVKDVPGFGTATNAANHASQANTVHPGVYHIFNQYAGMVNVTAIVGAAGSWINPADNVAPAPAPAPAPTPPANNAFVRFSTPMSLITNKQPTKTWDLRATTWAGFKDDADIAQGTPFTAVGKYTHPLGGVYFMNDAQFGQADQTGTPALYEGVNTVDLSPAPAPVAPEATPAAETPTPAPAVAPAAAPEESEAVNVPVTVKTWKDSFVAAAGTYKATSDATIKDLDGKLADQTLGHDQTVHVAGYVTKDGSVYYITEKSHEAGNWYGIPKGILVSLATTSKLVNDVQHPIVAAHAVLDDIDSIAADLEKDPEFDDFKKTLTPRGKAVAAVAETEEMVDGFFDKINLFKKKNK